MNYSEKYIKYKNKYLTLKNQSGGGNILTKFMKEKGKQFWYSDKGKLLAQSKKDMLKIIKKKKKKMLHKNLILIELTKWKGDKKKKYEITINVLKIDDVLDGIGLPLRDEKYSLIRIFLDGTTFKSSHFKKLAKAVLDKKLKTFVEYNYEDKEILKYIN